VDRASVLGLAKKSCRWDAPGLPGYTIGSSRAECVYVQIVMNPGEEACAGSGVRSITNGSSAIRTLDREAPGTQKVFLSHPDGGGFRVLIDGGGQVSFTSSSFSPDGIGMTIGVYPGVGRKGNADVWIGHFDGHSASTASIR
jgi:hypothetical protein